MEENKKEIFQEKKDNSGKSDERKMYSAKCSDCGNSCEVPFKPIEGKAKKCNDCFRKTKGNRFKKKSYDSTCSNCKKRCQVPFRPNDSKPILCRDCYQANKE